MAKVKRRPGRPKGSKNKPKREQEVSAATPVVVPSVLSGPKVRIWVVIGEKSTGKTGLILGLARQYANILASIPVWMPLAGGGQLLLHVLSRSMQEIPRSPDNAVRSIRRMLGDIKDASGTPIAAQALNLLIPLRADAHKTRPHDFPNAAAYLSHFVQEGFELQSICVLGSIPLATQQTLAAFGVPLLLNGPKQPMRNWRAYGFADSLARVRKHFGWA